MKKLALLLCLIVSQAAGQTAPNWIDGQVVKASDWKALFASKQDCCGTSTIGVLTVTGAASIAGTLNSTAATPYQINGSPVINLLANQASPILSPETQNIPNPGSIYFPSSLMVGYNTSATATSASTYNSMITANLTVVGTAPNHWGLEEHTISLLGTGNFNAELNVQKNYLSTASTVTVANGESFEAGLDNAGTISGIWHGYTAGMANLGTGTINRVYVFDAGIENRNVAANSVGIYVGYHCPAVNGSGSAPQFNYCMFNEDPKGEIVNIGHYSARNDFNVPTLSASGCGTGGALSATSNDDAGQLTIGVGGTITICSIIFKLNYNNLSTAIVVASDGGTPPSYTYNGGGINITALRSGGVYQYWAIGAN